MQPINFDTLQGLPEEFIIELEKHKSTFLNTIFFDAVSENSAISNLVARINEYCLTRRIYGFHYTRADLKEILKTGLTCRTGKEIRNDFLTKYSHLFSEDEIILIQKMWNDHFCIEQQKTRDNCLFFNFTTNALNDFGAESLLANFGGEQVFMPIQEIRGISEKIKSIGTPLILKCSLNPLNLKTYLRNPWGVIIVSTYHHIVNPDSIRKDEDGVQHIDVKPEDIEVIEYSNDMTRRLQHH